MLVALFGEGGTLVPAKQSQTTWGCFDTGRPFEALTQSSNAPIDSVSCPLKVTVALRDVLRRGS